MTMAKNIIELVVGDLEQKKQYRQNKARLDALPEPYRAAGRAVQHYVLTVGGVVDGATIITMQGDLADLWERAAADGASVRDIVGADPVAFAEDFVAAYGAKTWMDKERERLSAAIEKAGDGTEADG
jgi:DNA-binding ferritin-like protein (Dps family)